ncbi:MAG: hypothetical protein MRY21_00865 [Simkaniaceae bacterium]|nr:hypothetical protein [Simkaniaceae bacterium]
MEINSNNVGGIQQPDSTPSNLQNLTEALSDYVNWSPVTSNESFGYAANQVINCADKCNPIFADYAKLLMPDEKSLQKDYPNFIAYKGLGQTLSEVVKLSSSDPSRITGSTESDSENILVTLQISMHNLFNAPLQNHCAPSELPELKSSYANVFSSLENLTSNIKNQNEIWYPGGDTNYGPAYALLSGLQAGANAFADAGTISDACNKGYSSFYENMVDKIPSRWIPNSPHIPSSLG